MATITWTNTVGGSWSSAAGWSSGSVPGVGDTAVISGTSAFAVTVTSPDAAYAVTLNDPNATLSVTGGTLASTTMLIDQAGTLQLASAGVLAVGTLDLAGGSLLALGGTLSAGLVEGPLDIGSGALALINGLRLAGAGGIGSGTLSIDGGTMSFAGAQSISGGTIVLTTSALSELYAGSGTVTLAAGSTILALGQSGQMFGGFANQGTIAVASGAMLGLNGYPGTVQNGGTITVAANGDLAVYASETLVNTGALLLAPGAALNLQGVLTGAGTLQAAGAAIALQASASSAAIASVLSSGAALTLGAGDVLTNTGTIQVGAARGLASLSLQGTLAGGVVQLGQGGTLSGYGGVLAGVTLAGSGTLASSALSPMSIANGLTLAGGTVALTGALDATGSETIAGGTLALAGLPYASFYTPGIQSSGGTLTLAPSLALAATGIEAISGAALNLGGISVAAGGQLSLGTGGTFLNTGSIAVAAGAQLIAGAPGGLFENEGTVSVAAGGTLIIEGGFVNTGRITGTGAVSVGGSVTTAQLLADAAAANLPVEVGGTLDNTSATLAIGSGSTLGTLTLLPGALVQNGTITDAGGGLAGNGGTLSNVSYVGGLSVAGTLTVATGLALLAPGGGNGSASVGADAALLFEGPMLLDNATLQLGGALVDGALQNGLTLGTHLTLVHSAGSYASTSGPLLNNGTILAAQPGGSLSIQSLTNAGLLSVSNGDVVSVQSLQNGGTVSVSNGGVLTLGVGGTLSNTGRITETNATLNIDAAVPLAFMSRISPSGGLVSVGGTLSLGGGTLVVGTGSALGQLRDDGVISGGTIADAGGGMVFIGGAGSGGTLSAIVYQGALDLIPALSTLTVMGGLQVTNSGGSGAGTINLLGSGSEIDFLGGQTINNTSFSFGNNINVAEINLIDQTGAGAVLTMGSNVTVAQWGSHAEITLGRGLGDELVNDGLISAGNAGTFLIQGGTLVNNGKLQSGGGATLFLQVDCLANLAGGVLSGGSWSVLAGSTIDLGFDNPVTVLNATLYLGGPGATIQYTNTTTGQLVYLNQTLQNVGVAGYAVVVAGASLGGSSVLTDSGNIQLAGGTLNAAPLAIYANAVLGGAGTVNATAIYDSGIILAQGGNLVLNGGMYPGTTLGNLWINVGATLTVNGAEAMPVWFVGSTGELAISQASNLGGQISGFTGSDLIDLKNVGTAGLSLSYVGSTANSGVLNVSTNGTKAAAISCAGTYVTANFIALPDGSGGTLIKDPPVPVTAATLGQSAIGFIAGTQTSGSTASTAPAMTSADLVATGTIAASSTVAASGTVSAASGPGLLIAPDATSQSTMLTAIPAG